MGSRAPVPGSRAARPRRLRHGRRISPTTRVAWTPAARAGQGDVGGAPVVAKKPLSMGVPPEPHAGLDRAVAPAGPGLGRVMRTAEGGEVALGGRAALGIGDHVVLVAGA